MSNKSSKIVGKLIKEKSIFVKPLIYCVSSFVALIGLSQAFDYFQIDFKTLICKPVFVFIYIAIIIALIRLIVEITKVDTEHITKTSVETESDSLIEMLKEAESHSRWTEIIKLGSALSDFLWYTSRKKLRLAIGRFVEVAATQANDYKTLAFTLIEDIGNTTMVLGRPDEGIKAIKKGIKIAEEHQYYFLVARGYRNLANSYSFKSDTKSAKDNIALATEYANKITNEAERLSALGGIEYAKCKFEEQSGNYDAAIDALDKSIEYYKELSRKYPSTHDMNKDRIVKVYREKGNALIKKGNTEDAMNALYEGLKLAQETLNHENIVRCCTLIAKIQMDKDLSSDPSAIHTIEGLLNIAKQHIDKTDIPTVRKAFNDISKKFEIEKASLVNNE